MRQFNFVTVVIGFFERTVWVLQYDVYFVVMDHSTPRQFCQQSFTLWVVLEKSGGRQEQTTTGVPRRGDSDVAMLFPHSVKHGYNGNVSRHCQLFLDVVQGASVHPSHEFNIPGARPRGSLGSSSSDELAAPPFRQILRMCVGSPSVGQIQVVHTVVG